MDREYALVSHHRRFVLALHPTLGVPVFKDLRDYKGMLDTLAARHTFEEAMETRDRNAKLRTWVVINLRPGRTITFLS